MNKHEHRMQRHVLERRILEVVRTERLTPHMQRVVLGGGDLKSFVSAAADDHVKLFFPNEDGELMLPTLGPDGPEFPPGVKPSPMRDYTPRDYDAARRELTIDFVLHGDGPAARWAAQAAPGQRIGQGGPRGSFIPAGDFDHYWLAGDETALPAIGRRLEEMPATLRAHVLIEIPDLSDRQPMSSKAEVTLRWFPRNGISAAESDSLEKALQAMPALSGDTFYWMAAESRRVRSMRRYLMEDRGIPKEWIRATGYWKADSVGED